MYAALIRLFNPFANLATIRGIHPTYPRTVLRETVHLRRKEMIAFCILRESTNIGFKIKFFMKRIEWGLWGFPFVSSTREHPTCNYGCLYRFYINFLLRKRGQEIISYPCQSVPNNNSVKKETPACAGVATVILPVLPLNVVVQYFFAHVYNALWHYHKYRTAIILDKKVYCCICKVFAGTRKHVPHS